MFRAIFAHLQERETEITVHVVPRCRCTNSGLPQQQDTIPYAVKISVLRSWRWANDCPKHVEL